TLRRSVTDRNLREEALAQNSLRPENQDGEQHGHSDADLVARPDDISTGQLNHAEHDSADQGAVEPSQSTKDCNNERLESEWSSEFRIDRHDHGKKDARRSGER